MIKYITEISLEDFKKLNLIGYQNTRVDTGENSYRMEMLPVELNKKIDENLQFCKDEGYTTIVVAIHTDPTEEDITNEMKNFVLDTKTGEKRNLTEEEAFKLALYDASYLDKFMNRFTGHQTFQIGCGIKHLYSTRDYYECHGDYWKVKKNETKAIYMIHLD